MDSKCGTFEDKLISCGGREESKKNHESALKLGWVTKLSAAIISKYQNGLAHIQMGPLATGSACAVRESSL